MHLTYLTDAFVLNPLKRPLSLRYRLALVHGGSKNCYVKIKRPCIKSANLFYVSKFKVISF